MEIVLKKQKNNFTNIFLFIVVITCSPLLLMSCGENNSSESNTALDAAKPQKEIGVGPIKEVKLAALDEALVQKGKEIFEVKCTACHKIDKKYIGPAMAGILERRTPEWTMNMILNPEKMVKSDSIAQKLFEEYSYVPMANQSLTEEEARSILEYFRILKSSPNQ